MFIDYFNKLVENDQFVLNYEQFRCLYESYLKTDRCRLLENNLNLDKGPISFEDYCKLEYCDRLVYRLKDIADEKIKNNLNNSDLFTLAQFSKDRKRLLNVFIRDAQKNFKNK